MDCVKEIEVEVLKFVAPHLFYITPQVDPNQRTEILENISLRIKRLNIDLHSSPIQNEVVAVCHKSHFARAILLNRRFDDLNEALLYTCWLIDYGQSIDTYKIYKLSGDIKNIAPLCRAASLNNICYLQEELQLGIAGTIKTIPSILPTAAVKVKSLELLTHCDKVTFRIEDDSSDILLGELLIHKQSKVFCFTEELVKKGLIKIEKSIFQDLKADTMEQIKTRLTSIHHDYALAENPSFHCSTPKSDIGYASDIEKDELSYDTPLENGRHRRRNQTSKNESVLKVTDFNQKGLDPSNASVKPLTRTERLCQILEARKAEKKFERSRQDETASTPEDGRMKLAKHRRSQNKINFSKSEEDSDRSLWDSSISTEERSSHSRSERNEMHSELESSANSSNPRDPEEKVSPFAAITNQKKDKPKGLFLPSGMHISSSQAVNKKHGSKFRKTPKIPIDEDCPTIKIPTMSPGEQIPVERVDHKMKKSEESESSSDIPKTDIMSKQEFCKMVDGGCSCTICRLTLEDDDWDAPIKFQPSVFQSNTASKSQDGKSTGQVFKPPPLIKGDKTEHRDILSVDYKGMPLMEKKSSAKVLVHGESIPIPIKQVSQVNIHPNIYNNIRKINYKESKKIQYYAFPAITRNQHVFMVNDRKTGKTMAYLPILISFIMEKNERYSQLTKMGGGPIVVILCSNSAKCEEIYDLTRLILNKQNCKFSLVTYPGHGNISNIDILITMPTVLATLISDRATNFKRLCHLVLEDADIILRSHNDLVKKFLYYGNQVLLHRNSPKAIQLILCAHHWTNEIESILLSLEKVPTICIGNYLEAALYGKMKCTMKFLDTACKEQNVEKILKECYKFTKSLVLCTEEELERVETTLTLKGIVFTSLRNVSQEEDIVYLETAWNNMPAGNYSVLICTDDIYNTLSVTSVQLLIHYSLPHSWSQFIRRFSCFLEHIQTPLITKNNTEISSYIFIDEHCEATMCKFSTFMKIAGLHRNVPNKVETFFEDVALQEEAKRIMKKVELCQTLKLFGKCDSLYCKKRHFLDKDLDESSFLPKNGFITFKIMLMVSTGSCSIKLLEHFDLKGNRIQRFQDETQEIVDLIAKREDYYCVSKPVLSHLYLFQENASFFRCKVVEIEEEYTLVYLIDKGIYSKSSNYGLYKMPAELKKFPPQCYEVHLANLIPPFKDSRFSRLSNSKAQFLVDSHCTNAIMKGTILLQLGNNLWLHDVYEYRELHDKTLPSIGFQLTSELVKQKLAIRSSNPLEELYKLCKSFDIELADYKIAKPAPKKNLEQVEPRWAFLDSDEIHRVKFLSGVNPHIFYVRQHKFEKQLQNLEADVQKAIQKPFYPALTAIEAGKCCLIKDYETDQYCRGLILSINNEKAEVFCVDYGDIVDEDVSALKYISDEVISKLPFQSIQCSMYGIKPVSEEWSEAATDLLYKMAFEEDGFTFRPLFVKINSKLDNNRVQKQSFYSVTIKDGLSKRVLINELLINCGFALSDNKEIIDFDLPHPKEDEEEQIEEIKRQSDEELFEIDNNEAMNLEGFDCEIVDFPEFMVQMGFPVRKIADAPKAVSNELPPIKAAPPVDYLTPKLFWSQTGQVLKLEINISDVANARIVMKHHVKFEFSTEKEGKKYALNLILFAKVDNTTQYTIFGSHIKVTLKKCKEMEWPRLLSSEAKNRNIIYKYYETMSLEKPRKMLDFKDLNLSDSSSEEEDEEDGTKHFFLSDLDSDYDFDIPNDEE